MAGDFNKPVVTDAYASVLQSIKDLIADLAKGLDGTGTANVPVNTIRWSSTNNRFEKYNGFSWAALTSQYAIDVATVAGKSVGNASGNIPLSNGTLNTNLNAQFFNGLASNSFSKSASNMDNSVITADTRSSNHAPQDRAAGAYFDFRSNSVDGLSDGGSFHGVMSFRTFSSGNDFTGGNAHQLGFTDNGNLWYRAGSGASWGSWTKFLTDSNFNATIGAGARNLAGAGTYGGVNITGANGGWAGFQFNSSSRYFMSSSGQTGEFDSSAGAWQWRWDNGTLAAGTVPWARLSGVPAMNYLGLGGGSLTGAVSVTSTGTSVQAIISGNANYGKALLVQAGGIGGDGPQAWFHKPGVKFWSIGIKNGSAEGDCFVFQNDGHSGGWGSQSLMLTPGGQLWSSNYGWLHDYFTRTVTGTDGLYGGGSGSSLSIGLSNIGDGGNAGVVGGPIWDPKGRVTGVVNCNCNCGGG